MKKIVLLFSILTIAFGVYAQQLKVTDIPTIVKSKFIAKYPHAKAVTWGMEKDLYEAEFMNMEVSTSVLYKKDGTFMQSEMEMVAAKLPAAIMEFVSENFEDQKITEATKITNAEGTVTFEIEVDGTGFLFDADGLFITDIEEDNGTMEDDGTMEDEDMDGGEDDEGDEE